MAKNRPIKFRAWCEGTHDGITFSEPHMDYDVTIHNGNYCNVESGWDIQGEYSTITIMQWTGLKDQNGRDIYEHDVVEHLDTDNNCVVWFNEGEACFEANEIYRSSMGFYVSDIVKVIGNIYENPELFKS